MKAVEIRDQIRLPLSKCIQLVLTGIRYRLFRSAVTVVIIALATAFLMNMLAESITARKIAGVIDTEIAPRNTFLFWVSRLSGPLTERQLNEQLRDAAPGGPRWQEFRTWGSLTDRQLASLSAMAAEQLDNYEKFFEDLTEADRRALVGRATGTGIFRWLLEGNNFDLLSQRMKDSAKQMAGPHHPAGRDATPAFPAAAAPRPVLYRLTRCRRKGFCLPIGPSARRRPSPPVLRPCV